ncbi:LOW QUALITY PROTEIN: protein split ends-like [Cataglyphis hispanica]|uniref:LOW QUALITY PROTEIN: protein split ends-like n=1 Tax=Cataglyphis hispanica TaxID=1086592 RepID=UPI0021808CBE|nr:LOW QUALITY PROTEIN: protein split ends-like [Cataglyphis hispanica]
MVRETRYLWVGNLPENIREDRIREHFKRYGRVQSVKLLPRGEVCPVDGGSSSTLGEGNEGGSGSSSGGNGGGGGGGGSSSSGVCATVAFMDIKSAAKAHAIEHTLDDRVLTAQYYEPQHLQHRFPSHGSSEDHGSSGGSGGGSGGTGVVSGGSNGSGSTGSGVGGNSGGNERGERGNESFDSRGSHGSFYGSERSNRVVGTGSSGVVGSGGSGSGSGVVGGHPADSSTGDPSGYISRRPPPTSSYHVTSSRARDRLYPRTGPYVSGPPPPPHLDRHRGSLPPSSWSTYEPTSSRYGSAPPPPSPATNDSYQDEQGGGGGGGSSNTGALRQHKKQRRKSRSGSSSPSGSSRSGSSSSSRSGSSGGSTSGGSTSPGSSPHRTSNVSVIEDRRPVAICVRNLPIRSSDSSLKDGLFHEYKKHGKVTWVKVIGTANERYALVCFRKPEDVEKALEVSQDKLFFGCKIEVAPYQGYDVEDNEFRPYEAELDEYHPKATRTLFIGNLEKDVTASELRKHFEQFGEIIEIDIKKQGAVSSYAFCQYSDIGSVVKAMRSMDGEHLGANRIKLGFGKSMPTPCVWVDGIGDCTSEKFLSLQFNTFGPTTQVVVDRERGHALVFFDQISCAQAAVKEMRGVTVRGRRIQIDFASRECQETFYEHLERQGNTSEKPWDSRPSPASSFDMTIPSRRERNSFDSAVTVPSSSNRFTRYDTPPRSRTTNYSRTSGGSTPGASPAHPTALSRSNRRSYQDSYYESDYAEPTSRRFRSYDEFSQGSGASHDDYQSSVLSDGKLNDDDCPPPSRRHAVQSVVTSIDPPAPPPPLLPPPDIRHLQKERVHLLEQLEECHSSGDEVGFVSKKRAKLDNSSTTILCEDEEPEIASLLVTSHSSRKGMDFRRVSDNKVVHHSTRRGSCEGRGPGPCKRRRDATNRHHEHHDGSRPGTPLVDERPENLVPSEPRRFRERSHEGPLSLPLPRFAAQMLNNNNNTSSSNNNNGSGTRSNNASLAKIASPPCASLSTVPSPRAAPQPPASPPPRHTSSSPTSSDSEIAPQSPSLEERIRSLDEKYEKWSGSRALSAAGGDALAKLDASASERFRFRHKLLDLDLHEVQPSDIVKSVLAKRSVFDEDSKRLENFSEKYEPREFTGVIGVSSMIGSTAGLTTSDGGCTSKVCLQYPFPSHPPIQPASGTSVTSQIGINTSLSASLTPMTIVSSALKTDPRIVQHNCIHPTPATPITPGTSIKTVSPELPPVSLPIGLGSGTAASNSNGSGLASASSLLSSSSSIGNIHTLGTSTHRGLSISATTASPTVTAASDAFNSTAITTAMPIMTLSATISSATIATTTMSITGAISSMTITSSIAPPSSITSSSNSSSSSSLSASSTDLPRSRLRKETSGSNRESRDSRDGRDSRESKHSKSKDCQRRSRKDEVDVERNRKDRDEKESANIANDVGNTDNHNRDFKDNKELRYERKEREEKERRDKEDRERQERRDKEDRDRQEKKEREERERREKDEERRERERLDKERQEKDRREREERERERKEKEENELKEKERREKERIDRERKEREEKERQERREREERERREREEREKKEREIRLEREKQEKERLRREREEQERREKEERDRIERERRREEKERLERERKREKEEKERLERERRKEKEEREKMEKEKREKEERERLEKLEKEKHEKEKRREREDQERREKEKVEREKRRDREEKDKEKRERDDSRRQSTENHLHPSVMQSQTQITSAPVAIKRRCSSQDCPTDEDAKRMKILEHRRDSKDRSRQNRRSEDRKHRNDSHRSSRESRESRDSKESSSATQDTRDGELTRENNSRDSGSNKEKQRSKKSRSEKESRERSPRVSHESDKEFLSRLELSKRNDSTEQASVGSNHTRDVQHHQQQQSSTLNSHSDVDDGPLSTHEIQTVRNPSATDTDSDEPKKHSIFDIVDDEPAYISMYDKVKARSTKNMQKLEEEKRQVRLKDKFSQLKQSRARREEKKQSTSWDGDSVSSKALTEDEATSESDSTRTKSLSRKGSRSRIHSDTSEEEEPFNNKIRKSVKTERFLESDVDLGFADTEEKQNSLEASNSVIVNSVHTNIKEEPRTSDEDERISVSFRTNHPTIVMNNHERDSRKKSHKKKQKRQKNSISSENNIKVEPTETLEHKNKTNLITSSNTDCRPNHGTELTTITTNTTIVTTALENAEERMRADKKQRSKKDKRRDRKERIRLKRDERGSTDKRQEILNVWRISSALSDDVDDGPSNTHTFFNRFNNMTSENSVYASDSDGGRSSLDMDRTRRKTEKKRRHQPEDENSVDLAEAGREIEAKLLGMPSSPKSAPVCTTEPSDHDVFRFTDDNDSVEPSTPSTAPEKIKEKKKKRKKSKEERNRKDYHHHHHHHHHHEKSGELPYLGAEPSPPRASSPLVSKTISSSLPTPRETLLSPIPKVTSNISSITPPVVSDIQTSKSEKKKDKFIPGFGIEIDETIHENAVKSISEPDEKDSNCQSRSNREEPEVPVPTTPPAQNEDKPRVAISQEETEDAVAALLEETFGASTEDFSYEGEEEETETNGITGTPAEAPQEDVEEMQQAVESLNASTVEGDADLKPDTPQSEHDLQIDTDTEEDPNYETVDLTQPPKTPDIPSFYKSPTKMLNMTPVLTASEKSIEMRLPSTVVAKPQSPPNSVIAHSWTLNEQKPRESIKPVQLETTESDVDVTSSERMAQVQRTSASPPPPQYKQPMLVPCSVPMSEIPKSLSVTSSRPSPITVQPLYQRLPVSPQSQMVPMRQASPKMQTTTVSCSSSSNTTPLPPLVPSRIPPLVPSQSSPRISQPLSPNGQWSRNSTLSPHVPNVSKRKASPPPTKIAVCVPIPAQRPEAPIQQIYSTAATQQPVIQHASGMLAPAPGYPRGGLPPLTLNIPPRPYMPVPPLASGIQVKNSRDSSLGGKSVIETLLPVNPNEQSQRLEEPKLSPAIIPESTNKASTSPKVPSPNQPPTYIPETAKIEINASTSSPVFGKPAYVTDSYTMSSRTQKQISVSITTDNNLLSPRQKQEVSNLQLLTTHVPRSSTLSPVIVAHGQSHLLHKSVHTLGPPNVSSPNQPLIKTVVPIVPQQITTNAPLSVSGDKSVIPQTPCQRQSPISQNQLVKSHIPLVSTESQTIITRAVSSTASSMSTPLMNECLDHIQGQQLELDAEAQINQTAQPMQLTPPIQSTQPIDAIKQEPVDVKQEDTIDETEYNIVESEELLNQPCIEEVKQEKQEVVIKTEIAPCIPKDEVADTPVVPKLEAETPIKLEPVNEIKEEIKENDEMELDEEPVEDPLKEPSTDPLAIDSKGDPIDNKEDSDYWSAKEVNIESVIKKVDALCDGEGNDGDDETQQTESANSNSHDTSKNESDWFDAESSIENENKKNFGLTTEEHDESMEMCENESTKSRRGRAKSRRGSRGGVTTRRGGRNASTISHRRGGRSSRGSKQHVEKNKLPADVYEFHDDSEEDNAGRPRLILTIKSPGPNVTGPNAQPAIPVAAVKEIPPEEFVSPATNTRKSRRLAERDGNRNTVDDVIEDVVRGSPASKGLVSGVAGNMHATRRSTRHNNAPRNMTVQPTAPLTTELRKSPRGSRKTARRTSENNEDSGEEKTKETVMTPQDIPIKEEPKPAQPESPKAEEPAQTVVTSVPQKTVSLEPMTLIDPVTGMLIPMRESEEGQYIPVSTASNQVQTINRTLCEPRSGGLVSASPTNETPRVKSEDPLLGTAEPKKEAVIEHPSCQLASTQPIQPQTSVITKPQSPTVQVTSTITIAQSLTITTTIVTTVTATSVASTTTAQPIPISSSSQTKPTSLKAHVLNASKLVTSAQQQVVIAKPVASSLPNQTIVQNIVKSPVQAVQGLNLQIPPGRVVSPSLSPRAKQPAQLAPPNTGVKQGQPMSPVLNNTGVPPNPKQHLLQAAKQQTSTIVNMSQKMPINVHPVSVNATRMHQPVSQPITLKGINGQPHPLNPKTHLLQAVVPPIVTGSSSTQQHLVNPQPISTGNTRPPVPKTPATGTMEPQKVEVSMSGCIMMPTASPQSRSVPMPTYEAPLHGNTGATPPGGQYGLVPPHRSQSPPLPPPAHHHVNTSQSEVVNHYGGLTRGGELPPHYLHSQMLQYQYHLRAQQEALTAPRIAYHIPGTRSPHLPLDPKLETGIEDSHSPPLELRRGTRTPQDRTTDSPQVAQVYMLHGNVRLPPPPPQYNAGSNPSLPGTPAGARPGYYEPPPAHLRSQYPMAASEAPPEMGRAATPERCRKHHVVTPPPYASQVPPQADTFQMLLQRYPVMWQGLLALKNDQAAVQMHFVFGNPNVARDSLPCNSDGSTPPLRIAQRMRLEQTQVEGVARKMQTDNEHCMLLALPCGRDEVDVLQQSKNLQTGFIMYLQQKQAAGIVNIAAPGSQQPAYVVHIFPSCEFAHENLARIAPDLHQRVAKISHLLIVIATV